MNSLQVVSSSRFLLFATWFVAITSVPSAALYQQGLDAGTKPSAIHTPYDSSTFVLNIALIAAWITTSRWLSSIPGVPRGVVWWGWIVPVASLFVPRRVIGRAIGDRIERGQINLWWGCWVGFNVVANLGLAESLVSATPINPIKPAYEIAAACLLTGSYFTWRRIVATLSS